MVSALLDGGAVTIDAGALRPTGSRSAETAHSITRETAIVGLC
jgi:hypothetical protein